MAEPRIPRVDDRFEPAIDAVLTVLRTDPTITSLGSSVVWEPNGERLDESPRIPSVELLPVIRMGVDIDVASGEMETESSTAYSVTVPFELILAEGHWKDVMRIASIFHDAFFPTDQDRSKIVQQTISNRYTRVLTWMVQTGSTRTRRVGGDARATVTEASVTLSLSINH
jgi:hypothetical protein